MRDQLCKQLHNSTVSPLALKNANPVIAHKWEIHRQAPILKIAAAGKAAERGVQWKYTSNAIVALRPRHEWNSLRSLQKEPTIRAVQHLRFGRRFPS